MWMEIKNKEGIPGNNDSRNMEKRLRNAEQVWKTTSGPV